VSVLVDRSTRVVVQGITGREGAFHAARCKEYGTTVVGGVTPGKGGTTHEGFPVWNTIAEAVAAEVSAAAASAGRLLFRELAIDFPLDVAVVRSYADAGKTGT